MLRKCLFLVLGVVGAALVLLLPSAAEAGGVVGTGSAGSCSAAELHARLAGGGLVTFNCGAAPVTIVLTATETISRDTTLIGQEAVTLSGGDAVTLFHVTGGQVALNELAIGHGHGINGGAILQDGGALSLDDVYLFSNTASVRGGAIYSSAPFTLTNANLFSNTAGLVAGALDVLGPAHLDHVDFVFNKAEYDGALHNQGTLSLTGGVFFSNTATLYYAGALSNLGTATIANTNFVSNTSQSIGGALFNAFGATLRLSNNIFIDNHAGYGAYGGGVYNLGSLVVDQGYFISNAALGGTGGGLAQGQDGQTRLYDSMFYLNVALAGGGLVTSGTLAVSNTTFSGNTALGGGGLFAQMGTLTVTHSTLANNSALLGEALDNAGAQVLLHNTILSGTAGAVCGGNSLISLGHNLGSDGSCGLSASGDLSNTNPLLGPLAGNGGPTASFALLPGSPAINAADPNGCPATDQRGYVRVGQCDIGAFEVAFRTLLPIVRR